jgi:DNA-binding response OmpR family regulator
MKILVAEDDGHTRSAIVELLSDDGHLVLSAADGGEARDLLQRESFEMACLDVMMPRLSGFDVCRLIRATDAAMPILFLTAKADEIDKVVGLELGADDYIVKPFGAKEFVARVRAIARRCGRVTPDSESQKTVDGTAPFHFGPWLVAPKQQRARRDQETVELTPREVRLLRMLVDHTGEVVSRRDLFNVGWGTGRMPNSRTLDQTISQLRKRIDQDNDGTPLIQTVYGVGYRYDV